MYLELSILEEQFERISLVNMISLNVLVEVTIALVIFGKRDAIPDITITGEKIRIDNGVSVHQLKCSTTNAFDGCAVEFLLNRKTIESIRYVNKTCYNGEGVCYSVHCACSDGCDAFTFNYTKSVDKEQHIFECDTRIKDKRIFYRANASGSFVGDEFVDIDKTVTIMSGSPSPSQKVTAKTVFPKDQQKCNDRSDIIITLAGVAGLNLIINCVLLGVVLWMCLYQRQMKSKTVKAKVLKRILPGKQNRKTNSGNPTESYKTDSIPLTTLVEQKKRQKHNYEQCDKDTSTTTEQTSKINGRPSIHALNS